MLVVAVVVVLVELMLVLPILLLQILHLRVEIYGGSLMRVDSRFVMKMVLVING